MHINSTTQLNTHIKLHVDHMLNDTLFAFQEKKSKIAQELAATQQQMRGGGCSLSQGSRRILQERQRHTLKASQAAAAMAASGLLNQVCFMPAVLCCAVLCCTVRRYAVLCYIVPCSAILYCAVLCCAVLCHANVVLCCAVP